VFDWDVDCPEAWLANATRPAESSHAVLRFMFSPLSSAEALTTRG
jgi:hypothetical protein